MRTLPVDLRRLADAPMEVVEANVREAASTALSVFDSRSMQGFVASGRLVAPMGTHVTMSKKGVTIRHGVSARALSLHSLHVTPALSHPTTGANRQRVTVEGKRGNAVEVPRGFIWNETILMRDETGRKVASAKGWLVAAGADPSPAAMLGACGGDVLDAEADRLMQGLDDAGGNGQ